MKIKINFILMVVVLLAVWGILFWFMYDYGKEVRNDPCSVCAERMGEEVTCVTTGVIRTYYPNGSIQDIVTARRPIRDYTLNTSLLDSLVPDQNAS